MNKQQATKLSQEVFELLKDIDKLSMLKVKANTFSNGEWHVELEAAFTGKESDA